MIAFLELCAIWYMFLSVGVVIVAVVTCVTKLIIELIKGVIWVLKNSYQS